VHVSRRGAKELQNMNHEVVGVVVIGRNEGPRLVQCLKSLRISVEYVVYVDSGSTDGSVEEAKQRGITVLSLDMNQPFTAARARNEGFAALMVQKPQTRFVQFVDGDCELVEGWMNTAVRFISEHPSVAVVCGRRRERNSDASVYNRLCDLEWETPVGQTTACGGDSLMRVASFKAVGGFREELMAGEEPELCNRLKEKQWEIWRLDAEMSLHDAAMIHFGQWWRRSVRSGYGYAEVLHVSLHSPTPLYKREVERALFWGCLLPIAIGVGCLLHPVAMVGVVLYPLQIVRIALARGATVTSSWLYAIYVTIAKFAEIQGVMRFLWTKLRGKTTVPIEYKRIQSP
jgi:glycosyltransferase involved in cell wall biosynthesis